MKSAHIIQILFLMIGFKSYTKSQTYDHEFALPPQWALFKYGDQSQELFTGGETSELLATCLTTSDQDAKSCNDTYSLCIVQCSSTRLEALHFAKEKVRGLIRNLHDPVKIIIPWVILLLCCSGGTYLVLKGHYQWINLPLIGDWLKDDPTTGIQFWHYRWMKWITLGNSNIHWKTYMKPGTSVYQWTALTKSEWDRPSTPPDIKHNEHSDRPPWTIDDILREKGLKIADLEANGDLKEGWENGVRDRQRRKRRRSVAQRSNRTNLLEREPSLQTELKPEETKATNQDVKEENDKWIRETVMEPWVEKGIDITEPVPKVLTHGGLKVPEQLKKGMEDMKRPAQKTPTKPKKHSVVPVLMENGVQIPDKDLEVGGAKMVKVPRRRKKKAKKLSTGVKPVLGNSLKVPETETETEEEEALMESTTIPQKSESATVLPHHEGKENDKSNEQEAKVESKATENLNKRGWRSPQRSRKESVVSRESSATIRSLQSVSGPNKSKKGGNVKRSAARENALYQEVLDEYWERIYEWSWHRYRNISEEVEQEQRPSQG